MNYLKKSTKHVSRKCEKAVHLLGCDWLVKLFVGFAIGDSDLGNLGQSGATWCHVIQ